MSERRSSGPLVARALAPAKINPFLDVLGKRADGYHELRTFLVAVDLCDEVEARIDDTGGISLVIDGDRASADIPADERNLAWKAAAACLAHARERGHAPSNAGVQLRLTKRIPSQAGLGGGSSDAAAAWLATEAALGLAALDVTSSRGKDADDRALARDSALAYLGSDTVFFARAGATGAAWCTGRGEIVDPKPAPRGWSIALVTPDLAAPTGMVYSALGISLRESAGVPSLKPVDWSSIPALEARTRLANRLEPAALSAVEGLSRWRALLDDAGGAHFMLSGSGSSFFGLYGDHDAARAMLQTVRRMGDERGLASRFCDIVRPCGHGARVLTER